ncbi:MAG: helix-turn-helix transcriptional regulator [Thermoleophilaceae bacterium]|nr:helix-turn-helix transcriptional regulator [Thermoleophilaceae bacterium]
MVEITSRQLDADRGPSHIDGLLRAAPAGPAEAREVLGDGRARAIAPRRAQAGDALTERPAGAAPKRLRSALLSGRERRVLAELARGISTDEIAERLHVSPHTVRTHVKNIMRKLGARTRAHAVAIAITEDAIEADEL